MYTYKAKIVSVYDGDTCRVDVDMGFNMWMRNQPIRWSGIDAPEMRGEERELGIVVRDIVRELVLDREYVYIRTQKSDKYGRWLGVIFNKTIFETFVEKNGHDNLPFSMSINSFLLENGYAEPYQA